MSFTETITVNAVTEAAVSAYHALSDAQRGSAEAGDLAGKSNKEAGRIIQQGKAILLENADAQRRLEVAIKTTTLTTQAFGKGSREAAEAEKALTKAHEEAKRASQAAAATVEKHSKAMLELSKAGGEQTAGMKRNIAAVQAMGKDFERSTDKLHQLELGMKAASATTSHLSKNFSALTVAGGALIAGGISRGIQGIGDGMKFALKSSIDFESSMADVAKVVDGLKTPTGEATAEYRKMEQQMFALSERIAVAPEGFAKIAAAAGQAGIAGSELTRFAEDAAKTSVAFGITADAAGEGLAKLRTGLKLNQDDVMSLAGTMNHLSNSMASEAGELLDAVQRVGSIGAAANVSGQEIAALSSAMISAGAGSEMAATGTKNFLLALAAGSSATKAQADAFASLGLNAETVAKNVTSTDMVTRAAAMTDVVSRLSGLADDKRISTLKQLFGSETVGTIGPLATNLDLLTKSLSLAADKTAAASSVQAEFESRSKTTENTLQLLKNTMTVTAITVGSALLPELSKIATSVAAWAKENRELIKDSVVGFVTKATAVAKELWPVLKTVASTISSVTSAIGPANLAYLGMAGKIASVTGGLGGLTSSLVSSAGKMVTTMVPALAGVGSKLASLAGPAGLFALATAGVAALSFAALKYLFPVADGFEAIRLKAVAAHQAMIDVRLEAMRNQASKLGAENAKQAEENARRKTILEAGFNDEAMAESARAAGMEARRKALHGRRLSQLSDEDKDLVKASVKRAMINEKLAYMERADAAGNGAPTKGLDTGPTDKEKKAAARAGAKSAKDKSKFAEESRDFDVEMANYAAKENKRIREESVEAQAAAWDAEQAIFDKKAIAFDRELEMLGARSMAEEEAQAAREALLDRRMEAERAFARGQLLRARTDSQREQAQTKVEEVEYRKRLMLLKRASAEEDKEQAKRVKVAEKVSSTLRDLGTSMVDAAYEAATGTKGAMLEGLSSFFKGVAKEMAMLSLVNAAKGVSAAASVGGAWQAPGYFRAAIKAGLVAVAAGGAAIGLGAAADARASSGEPKKSERADSTELPDGGVDKTGTGRGGTGSGTSGGESKHEAQTVPLSYFDPSRAPTSANSAPKGDTINADFAGAFFIGTGSPEKAAQALDKLRRTGKAAGKR